MKVPYGQDHLISVPLIVGGDTGYLASIPTIAAGDALIDPDSVMVSGVREPGLQVNPDAFILGFDSMSERPEPGDVLDENGAGTATCVVMFVVTVAGTDLSTGDMSGFMFVKSVSGQAWSDNDQIDNTTKGTTDIATVDAGTTGTYTLATNQIANTAGLFAFAKGKAWLAITAEELTCKQLEWRLKDQTGTEEWEDTSGMLETVGHPAAYDPKGALYAGECEGTDFVDANTLNIPVSGHASFGDWFNDTGFAIPATDDIVAGFAIECWDADDPDTREITVIAAWDANGGGANEGQLTLAGRGFTREPTFDDATTVRFIVWKDYLLVADALATQAKADVNAEVDTAVAAIKAVTDNLPNSGALTDLATQASVDTVDSNVDAILADTNEIQGDLADGGRLDLLIDAILADTGELQADDVPGLIAALNDPAAAAIADAVWDEAQSAHTTVGSFGEIATEIASILADTNELQGDDVPGLIAALNDVSTADVNAQLVDVLSTDTQTLPGQGAPTATPTLTVALMYLYKAWRNKSDQTSSELTLYADDGTTADQQRTVSDDGTTFTAGEMGTGA